MTMVPKTPEEIKKGLELCSIALETDACTDCPYHEIPYCGDELMTDAGVLLQQLEAENSRKDDTIRNLTELLNAAHEETVAVKQERDAAVTDFTRLPRPCGVCVHGCLQKNDCRESFGDYRCSFEWRGVCPENTEVQE